VATRVDFEKLNLLVAEAAALCEAAQQEFERINKEIQESIRAGRDLIASVEGREEKARQRLFAARELLSGRLRQRRRLLQRRVKGD
jgi:hypothetical protein